MLSSTRASRACSALGLCSCKNAVSDRFLDMRKHGAAGLLISLLPALMFAAWGCTYYTPVADRLRKECNAGVRQSCVDYKDLVKNPCGYPIDRSTGKIDERYTSRPNTCVPIECPTCS